MSALHCILAQQGQFEEVVSYQRNVLTSGLSESEIIFGAVGLVVVFSFLGVFIFRKQLLRKRRRHHHAKTREALAVKTSNAAVGRSNGNSHGKRRRRRRYRHRNPTLAETRGLPPNRNEPSADPSLS